MRLGLPTERVLSALMLSLALGSALGGGGCARADSVADRHIAEMREAIGAIQAEQDRANQRLGLLEVSAEDSREARAAAAAAAAGAAAAGAAASRAAGAPSAAGGAGAPAGRTVQIGDSEEPRDGEDPNDPNARPEIRLQGPPGAAARALRGKSLARGRGEGRVDPDDGRSDSPRPSALEPEAKKSYDAALGLVGAKQYDRALEALAAFLVRWPDHPYAENAMYWRGECYFARGEYLRAAEQFEAVLARFNGNKAPDALLKIGHCHDRLGSSDRAKEYWDRLRRDYPRSEATKKIPASSVGVTRGSGPKESR